MFLSLWFVSRSMFHVPFQLSAQFQTSGADAESCEGLPQRHRLQSFTMKMAICGFLYPLVTTNSLLLSMVIYSGFTHWKWWFSIVMLVCQRVCFYFVCFNTVLIVYPRSGSDLWSDEFRHILYSCLVCSTPAWGDNSWPAIFVSLGFEIVFPHIQKLIGLASLV